VIARLRAFFDVLNRNMGRLWLTILYFTAVLPFGIAGRFRARNNPRPGPAWHGRKTPASDLAEARKQF
jgi:hypothetical protein